MFRLIMCLIVLISYSEAKLKQVNQVIRFRFDEKYTTNFTVEKYKPLDIILDNFFAKYAWCLKFHYAGPSDTFVNITLNGSSDSFINVPKVVDAMLTKWWCSVLQEYSEGKPYYYNGGHKYTAYNIVFNLHTKDETPKSPVSAKTSFDYKLIYIIISAGVAIFLLVIIVMIKKCCCKKPNPPLQLTIDPDSVFYLNLEIFRQQYEREIQQAQEAVYEEIN